MNDVFSRRVVSVWRRVFAGAFGFAAVFACALASGQESASPSAYDQIFSDPGFLAREQGFTHGVYALMEKYEELLRYAQRAGKRAGKEIGGVTKRYVLYGRALR